MKIIMDYPGGSSVITRILIKGKQEVRGRIRQCDNRITDWSDAAMNQGMPTVSRNWKKQLIDSSLEPLEETSPTDILF